MLKCSTVVRGSDSTPCDHVRVASVLLVSAEPIGAEMAGPAIRCLELGRALAASHDVLLASPASPRPLDSGPEVATSDPSRPRTLRRLLKPGQVVVAAPLAPRLLAGVTRRGRAWIVDFYNPEPFEGLELRRRRPALERRARDTLRIDRLAYAARAGTAFVCASERQRDMWLGFLAASRRLDSACYERDPAFRTLLDVVPFGLPAAPPQAAAEPVVRGRLLPADARILVWNGGLWDWLDPLTVVRALALLRAEDPRWVLLFSGSGGPGGRDATQTEARTRALVDELGLGAAGAIRFEPGWRPYSDRAQPLLEADVGVSVHPPTLESRFAARARMLDFVWARLPIVCTEGDEWAARVRELDLGEVVPPHDPAALAAAAGRIADAGRTTFASALDAAAAQCTWQRSAAPLDALVDRVGSASRRRSGPHARALAARYSAAELAVRVRR